MKVEELAFTRKMEPCLYDEEGAWSKTRNEVVAIKAYNGKPKSKNAAGRDLGE